jgi:hypothetical protein
MAAAEERLQFRIDAGTAEWLRGRAERMPLALDRRSTEMSAINKQAALELGLWRMALETELGRIRLTLEQARCLVDVLNGTVLEPTISAGIGLAYASVYDAFRLARTGPFPDVSSYGAKHGPDDCDPGKWEQALLDYLGQLGPVADFALRYAISRWWQADGEPTAEGFAAVGLRVISEP